MPPFVMAGLDPAIYGSALGNKFSGMDREC